MEWNLGYVLEQNCSYYFYVCFLKNTNTHSANLGLVSSIKLLFIEYLQNKMSESGLKERTILTRSTIVGTIVVNPRFAEYS